ncbi:hypothetical protein MMC22_011531 [Lobaria immixta]|nr:hypothetical protein [Lobaria immixta]
MHHRGALALQGRTGRRGDSSKPARLVHSESRRFIDLSSCESIQDFAPHASKLDQLDGLLENAAVLEVKFTLAEEYESSTMVNDVGTFLLALLQLPKLRETASKFNIVPHVTFVSSEVAFWAKFNERHTPSTFGELNNPKSFPVRKIARRSRQAQSRLSSTTPIPAFASRPSGRELKGLLLRVPEAPVRKQDHKDNTYPTVKVVETPSYVWRRVVAAESVEEAGREVDKNSPPWISGELQVDQRPLLRPASSPGKTPRIGAFKKLFALFDELGAKIHQLEWTGWGFLALRVSEPYPEWKKRLPFTVNKTRIGYIFGVQTVYEKTLRRKPPMGRKADNEAYGYLRPGVMIASKGEPYDVMTTSGVCLRSPSESKYITVAKHGSPWGVGGHVLHPNRNGHMIGEVVKVFGKTDIALAKLAGVHYSRKTFSEIDAAVQPFTSLVDLAEHQVGEFVFMDTPYNGRCEGVLMKSFCRRLPADEPADNVEYVVGSFTYFGNGGDTLFDGCCGAVVWDSKYGVLGQFRFQQGGTDELCYCPSFSMLKGLGYSLSEA